MYTNKIFWTDDTGTVIHQLNMGLHHYDAPSVIVSNIGANLVIGELHHNGVRVGDYEYRNQKSNVYYYTKTRKFNHLDTLTLKIVYPEPFELTINVRSDALTTKMLVNDIVRFTSFFEKYVNFNSNHSKPKLQAILDYLRLRPRTLLVPEEHTFYTANLLAEINNRLVGDYILPFANVRVFTNNTQFNNYRNSTIPIPGDLIINDNNKTKMGYSINSWTPIIGGYTDILQINRVIHSDNTDYYYRVRDNNTLERFNPVVFDKSNINNNLPQ